MSVQHLGIPKGTRDFGPEQMVRRKHIFSTIEKVFLKYGYQPLETPSMENLSTLTGKYGEEGDQLLYKILNSGDFMEKVSLDEINEGYKKMTGKIAGKGLRYDLTVPFARYVVMNQHEITFPFKRYQLQPVWRADRPQKGRYREFYQCDADVVGADSLLCEAEIVAMIQDVLNHLLIKDYSIKINHRKILTGITEAIDASGKETDFCVAVDKLDKVGLEKVIEELKQRGFSQGSIDKARPIFTEMNGTNEEKLDFLEEYLKGSETGRKGVSEIRQILEYVKLLDVNENNLQFDVTLARGLTYYTGAIIEVKAGGVLIGSIGGGGRYDNLTGAFGLPGISGVGFSFGVDRIYDVMEELKLFTSQFEANKKVLVVHFDEPSFRHGLSVLAELRKEDIHSEIYPDQAKIKKQLTYANKKGIPFVILVGSEEIRTERYPLKDMSRGEQQYLSIHEIVFTLK
jgi:histidyl-tRNA synthetase